MEATIPIPLSNYVLITSGVAAAASVPNRNLGGLIITGNPLVPTGAILQFTSAAAVGTYFGTSSEEYLRAVFYFGWISKNITAPNQISFWNWNNDAATGSLIYGAQAAYILATYTAVSSGSLNLTLGGATHTLTGINLSAAGSLAAVASDLQTAIQAYSAGGSAWTAATVAYVAAPTQGGQPQFNLTSGTTGTDVVSVGVAGSGTDLGPLLGWSSGTGVIYSNGTAAQTITTNLNNLINLSNNFGSFCFTTALAPVIATIQSAATWNNSLTPNNQFMFSISTTLANYAAWSADLLTTGGCALTVLSPQSGSYAEMEPMMTLGATNYSARNSVQNYMYQVFNDTASVTTGALQTALDAARINYYGNTQTAGQILSFYQRGVMMGIQTNPTDMGIYANEIWFKDDISSGVMTVFLDLAEIPANTQGQAILLSQIQTSINRALFNGTISVGKTLTNAQQLYITQATGDPNAWQQVQNIGYWVSIVIEPFTDTSGITEYKAVYTLLYSKNDVIRTVIGSDVLI